MRQDSSDRGVNGRMSFFNSELLGFHFRKFDTWRVRHSTRHLACRFLIDSADKNLGGES